MALSYHYMTDKEDKERNLVEKGEYVFQVKSVVYKKTKSNENMQLEVELTIKTKEGQDKNIKDWVVVDMESMAWKFRHFAYTCDLGEKYESKTLEAKDFLGKIGVVKLGQKEYEKDGEIKTVNNVLDYIKPSASVQKNSATFNDDIAF